MRHENLKVWQKSCEFAVQVYKSTSALKDFNYRDQLTRSCLSVASNIAEGMERASAKDKLRFLVIARASLAELKTQILIGVKVAYIDEKFYRQSVTDIDQIARMLAGLIKKFEN
ncbi:four helix bundle protein [Thalassotalea mangrovi]|uniref:Four helix bundle protein n=1 Tax=Thalassotalea mangrovi TaxID=2572245 RepID=A0A4U1B6H7_9GAMM|nr:four helix bundle protein [Thalassotalea mangrovi]TKB46115.1 four helix bundle protein [Thalassotalea mangrovi]